MVIVVIELARILPLLQAILATLGQAGFKSGL